MSGREQRQVAVGPWAQTVGRATRFGSTMLASRDLGGAAKEFLRFGVVGFSGVWVNLGLYLVGTRLLGLSLYSASPIAIEASLLWNFVWNDSWTFRSRSTQSSFASRLVRFHAISLLGGTVNYLTLILLVRGFHWWDVAATLAGIAAGVAVNFTGNSIWTWREGAEL